MPNTQSHAEKATTAPGLYTLIIDFEGGTYLRQESGSSVSEVAAKFTTAGWKSVPLEGVDPSRENVYDEVFDRPNPIDGLKNTWCTTVDIDDERFLLVHIVWTREASE